MSRKVEESNNLWFFIKRDEMKKYVDSGSKIEMENVFVKSISKASLFASSLISVIIRQTRTGLYFNIYENRKKVGHASFHYDENRPGSISHIVDDCDYIRDDVIIRKKGKYSLKFLLMGCIDDVYGFFSLVAKGLSKSFSNLVKNNNDIIY